jgi:hypothetical protein
MKREIRTATYMAARAALPRRVCIYPVTKILWIPWCCIGPITLWGGVYYRSTREHVSLSSPVSLTILSTTLKGLLICFYHFLFWNTHKVLFFWLTMACRNNIVQRFFEFSVDEWNRRWWDMEPYIDKPQGTELFLKKNAIRLLGERE